MLRREPAEVVLAHEIRDRRELRRVQGVAQTVRAATERGRLELSDHGLSRPCHTVVPSNGNRAAPKAFSLCSGIRQLGDQALKYQGKTENTSVTLGMLAVEQADYRPRYHPIRLTERFPLALLQERRAVDRLQF